MTSSSLRYRFPSRFGNHRGLLAHGGEARARDWRGDAHSFRIPEVGIDGGDHDARLHGDQVDPDERDADPCVDDDPLIEDAIEYVDEARASRMAFNRHGFL